MIRKIALAMVLIFGTLNSLVSCTKAIVDKAYYNEFRYINSSGRDIIITAFNIRVDTTLKSTHNIIIDDVLLQKIELFSGINTGMIATSDSVSIVFGNKKLSNFNRSVETTFNILHANNYDFLKKELNNDIYTYTFTESDYENAEDCNGSCE